MVYFGTIGQLYKTTSFLVVSTSFHSEMRKSIGNKEETTSLFFFITITKLKHATRVTTLWLKQPICFYSVEVYDTVTPYTRSCPSVIHSIHHICCSAKHHLEVPKSVQNCHDIYQSFGNYRVPINGHKQA